MVSKCPRDFDDATVREKCERSYASILNANVDFMDMIPVTDGIAGITYRNRHCMECNNGTQPFIKWKTYVTCKQPTFLPKNRFDVIKRLERLCHLEYRRPETVPVGFQDRPCSRVIDRCSVNDDAFLTSACASYTSHYKGYKNIHCWLCNGNNKQSATPVCLNKHSSSMIGFRGLFDLEGIPFDVTEKNDGKLCDMNSKYDESVVNYFPFFFLTKPTERQGPEVINYFHA